MVVSQLCKVTAVNPLQKQEDMQNGASKHQSLVTEAASSTKLQYEASMNDFKHFVKKLEVGRIPFMIKKYGSLLYQKSFLLFYFFLLDSSELILKM